MPGQGPVLVGGVGRSEESLRHLVMSDTGPGGHEGPTQDIRPAPEMGMSSCEGIGLYARPPKVVVGGHLSERSVSGAEQDLPQASTLGKLLVSDLGHSLLLNWVPRSSASRRIE